MARPGSAVRPAPRRRLTLRLDGHPLYTYAGGTGPGTVNGNNLDLSGGLWYEVRVSG